MGAMRDPAVLFLHLLATVNGHRPHRALQLNPLERRRPPIASATACSATLSSAVIVSVVSFTSTRGRPDEVSAPYRNGKSSRIRRSSPAQREVCLGRNALLFNSLVQRLPRPMARTTWQRRTL